jgi:predicted DNA-binding transcriptional regulator YafY
MAKSPNQKLKLLYLMDYFQRNTDEQHGVTMEEILAYLSRNDISAERKSIYDDVRTLQQYGMDLVTESRNRTTYYKLVGREFETAELKLLVDAVQASKFISSSQSESLIKKLEQLTSRYEANNLQRQVYVLNRNKNDSRKTLINIDAIHEAINENRQITFRYLQWSMEKKLVEKNAGKLYSVSPFALVWDDENYYLVAYDNEAGKAKHFRVDKMGSIAVTEEERQGQETFADFNQAAYAKQMFGMFGGKRQQVTLAMDNSMIGVAIDRFGREIMIFPDDAAHFHFTIEVEVSAQFYGWLLGLGDKVRITAPEETVRDFKEYVAGILDSYKQAPVE